MRELNNYALRNKSTGMVEKIVLNTGGNKRMFVHCDPANEFYEIENDNFLTHYNNDEFECIILD